MTRFSARAQLAGQSTRLVCQTPTPAIVPNRWTNRHLSKLFPAMKRLVILKPRVSPEVDDTCGDIPGQVPISSLSTKSTRLATKTTTMLHRAEPELIETELFSLQAGPHNRTTSRELFSFQAGPHNYTQLVNCSAYEYTRPARTDHRQRTLLYAGRSTHPEKQLGPQLTKPSKAPCVTLA